MRETSPKALEESRRDYGTEEAFSKIVFEKIHLGCSLLGARLSGPLPSFGPRASRSFGRLSLPKGKIVWCSSDQPQTHIVYYIVPSSVPRTRNEATNGTQIQSGLTWCMLSHKPLEPVQ